MRHAVSTHTGDYIIHRLWTKLVTPECSVQQHRIIQEKGKGLIIGVNNLTRNDYWLASKAARCNLGDAAEELTQASEHTSTQTSMTHAHNVYINTVYIVLADGWWLRHCVSVN